MKENENDEVMIFLREVQNLERERRVLQEKGAMIRWMTKLTEHNTERGEKEKDERIKKW